jgi:hypothetical protein
MGDSRCYILYSFALVSVNHSHWMFLYCMNDILIIIFSDYPSKVMEVINTKQTCGFWPEKAVTQCDRNKQLEDPVLWPWL